MEEQPPIAPPKTVIRIVGTSHIATQSAKRIKHAYDELQPDIVCIELDRDRLHALLEKAAGKKEGRLPLSMIRQVGATGYLFALVARYVQRKLGNVMNVQPGVDMLEAVKLARDNGKELKLVDQHIQITMRRLSQRFTFREKLRVVWDVISAPLSKKKVSFDLRDVPDSKVLEQLMALVKDRYPSIYDVLIIERNIVMARNMDALVRRNPGKKFLLVIGAGHEEDLRERLKHVEHLVEVI
jgi:pheromone shutdown protein TraB